MPVLSVTSRGQVTLRKEYLKHLGIESGGKVEVQVDGNKLTLRSARKVGSIEDIFGFLDGKTSGEVLTIEEIKVATEKAWAGER